MIKTGLIYRFVLIIVKTKQVAYLLTNQNTIDREFGNLLKIPDNHRKIVVSMDDMAGGNISGIEHIDVKSFLLTQ